MFGLRWIAATSFRWHSRPTCRHLRSLRTRCGWTPFLITAGYGRDFYLPCSTCVTSAGVSTDAA